MCHYDASCVDIYTLPLADNFASSKGDTAPTGLPGILPMTVFRGGSFLFIKAQPAGRLSLPGPSAVLVKQLKAGSCHAE